MPMDTIILKHIFYSAILFAENLYEFKTWKMVGKTIYHFFGEKSYPKICIYQEFFCNFALDFESEKNGTLPRQNRYNYLKIEILTC